ncbi:4-carboxy-4-hydroxy-2-oxoadipate aldolase/oxaloacetate decarboxylase [Bordetella petrii]|uniref:4-carboxy-4-hydroxy-2-oxoadipate aldolase/oxaloacetate decarboxylase n=1 Tax=Bordetella petrii TaxID=94624 RepID=UPI001A97C5AB|nr:4-carboxy-4-hydroxy-2-oxoadipate aldolase/oxaloacetate decarboxylase [Bordetella petrii]
MNRSLVYLRVNRVDAAVCAQAQEATVSDLHEAEFAAGRRGLMSSRMRPVLAGRRIAGPAVTAYCGPGDNLMMHRALYLAQPGDVLVVVCEPAISGAQWGDMAARYALKKGLAGIVVQGCVRDTDMLRELGSPTWSTHVLSSHPDKAGHGRVNAPLVCDGVSVSPGDLIVADGDGVICVPREHAAQSVERALARMRKEDAMAQEVANGAAVWDLSGAAASYAKMDIQEIDAAFDDVK